MPSTITHDRSVSINDDGVTTIRYAVTHDQDRSVRLTFEEHLPDAVDPTSVAVDRDRGKWAVYDDGTVQWAVSVRSDETVTGELGVVCTDPETVTALVEESRSHVVADEPAVPPDPNADLETVEPNDLASTTADERVPESVYEAVRAHQSEADATDRPVVTRSSGPSPSAESRAPATDQDSWAVTAASAAAANESDRESDIASGSDEPVDESEGRGEDGPADVNTSDAGPADVSTSDAGSADVSTSDAGPADVSTSDDGPADVSTSEDESWNGDPLENALRVQDRQSRADENAYRFVLELDEDEANETAIEVLTGLLNGTTVFGANPTLPDLEAGCDPETLTVTISSALDEEAIVAALEDIEHASVEHFETLDVDLAGSEPVETNADQQFRLLDDAIDRTSYDAIADDVEAVDTGKFDFGNEPVSYDELVSDADAACAAADGAPVNTEERSDQSGRERAATTGDSHDVESHRGGQTDGSGDAEPATSERVTARLLEELEAGGVTERERIELRRRLGVDPRTSTELRLDHLHSRVDELAAYTDALEAFLDEEGTAQRILTELSENIASLEARTDDLEDELESRTSDLEAQLESRTSEVEDQFASRIDDLADRLETEVGEARTERETIEDQVESLASEQAAQGERVSGIADAVSSNSDDIDHLAGDVRSDIDELVDAVEALESTVESLDDRLDALAETVEQNSTVREKLETLAS
jgi:hypothetical protein